MADVSIRMSAADAQQCLDEIRVGTLAIKEKLIELYEGRGWEALGYDSWRACIQAELKVGTSQAYRLLDAAYVEKELSPTGEKVKESQARELAKAPEGKRAETLAKAKESAAAQGRAQPTAKDIREAVDSGGVKTTPHDATQQEAEGPRRAATDGDDGPCPKGGEHDIFSLHGGRYCGRCKAHFPADDGDDTTEEEAEFASTYKPDREFAEETYDDMHISFDFEALDQTCQFWVDNCPLSERVALSNALKVWAQKAKETK